MELVKPHFAHTKSQEQIKQLLHWWKALKTELATAKDQFELARNDDLIESVARSLAKEFVDKLTTKVADLEESLSQLQRENNKLRGYQNFEAQRLE